MTNDEVPHIHKPRSTWRIFATVVTVILLPPFLALAVAPMLLLLAPVALIGIPFIVPAMLSGSLAARTEARQRELKPLPRHLKVVH